MMASFQPPVHEHPLIPRELSDKCAICCLRCGHPICGETLCCLDCNLFFHQCCTEWPVQIHHPCHAQHPLSLVADKHFNSNYCCQECGFSVRADALISTMPPADGKEAETFIQHSAHVERALVSFTVTAPNDIRCGACRQGISGQVYGCRQCIYLLHESCARLPNEISQHPFHPQHCLVLKADPSKQSKCNACGLSHQFGYCCEECQFNLDVSCVASAEPPRDKPEEVPSVFTHQHPLNSFDIKEGNKQMTCKACGQHVTGSVYGCPDCAFFLHRSCTKLDRETYHFLHPGHRLILREDSLNDDGSVICNCCSEASPGFIYSCGSCRFNLDIECALKTQSALDDRVSARVQHFAHDHVLTLHYLKGYDSPECNACKQPSRGLAYSCLTCGDFSLHLSCFQLPRTLEHEFHSLHPVSLLKVAPDTYVVCDACKRKCTGFAFQCKQCNFHLDVECASRNSTLQHPRHEHRLSYFKRAAGLYCYACRNICNADLYRCVPCGFNLHHDCAPTLPVIITHEFHFHPLALCGKYKDDIFEEQYCDICEETRNTNLGLYRCEECDLSAHVSCLMPWLQAPPDKEKPVINIRSSIMNQEIERAVEQMEAMKTQLAALLKRRGEVDTRAVPRA